MKLFWLLVVLLAVPIVPALLAGAQAETFLLSWLNAPHGNTSLALLVGLVLAADIFLPVPSGPLVTLAGAKLGVITATLVGAIGLTLGSVTGFVLSRHCGRPLAKRYASQSDLQRLQDLLKDRQAMVLLVTRPLPVLAEATVLACGLVGVTWRQFLLAVFAGNLLFAALLAALGKSGADNQKLTFAVFFSMVVPFALADIARRRWMK